MTDTKIEWLKYRVVTPATVDFKKAPQLNYRHSDFEIDLVDDVATFKMIVDVSTEEEARHLVEPFINAWEVISGLSNDPGDFRLEFTDAHIVERNPRLGHTVLFARTLHVTSTVFDAVLSVSRVKYPDVPTNFELSNVASAMYYQYEGYRSGRITLAAAAYFCLTMLMYGIVPKSKVLDAVSKAYAIDLAVLKKLSELTSTAGGPEARKAQGYNRPYTRQEIDWLRRAMPLLIRRAGEQAANASTLVQIEMKDLPQL